MSDKYDCLKLKSQLCFPLYACSKEIIRRYKPFLDRNWENVYILTPEL